MEAKIITIANRLSRNDSVTKLDVWYKTVLQNIQFFKERVTSVNGTQVSIGEVFTILIPFDDKYKPYNDWKTLEDKENYYTLSPGDYIFLDTQISENILPSNIIALKNQHIPNVCEVRSIVEVQQRFGATVRLKVTGI